MTGKPNLYGTSDHIAIFSTHAAMLTLKLKCLKIISGCAAKILKMEMAKVRIKKCLHLDLRRKQKTEIKEKALM